MDRLFFIPLGFILAIIARPYNLTYLGTAILVGVIIVAFDCMRTESVIFRPETGTWFLIIGSAFLGIALFICDSYAITFDDLDHDKTFPKLIKRLPYIGISSITMGTVIAIKSFFRTKES